MAARDALPVLTPGTPVLLRADRRVHIGSDPRTALVLDVDPGVTSAKIVAILQRLRTPQRYRQLRRDVRSSGLTASGFWSMLDRIVAAGKATAPPTVGLAPFSVGVVGHGEIAELLLTGLARDGHAAAPYDPRELDVVGRGRPQLVVIADQPVPDPAVWEPLMGTATPHLPAHVGDDVGTVGPLVLPGRSSCLRCVDLHRADLDPLWPVVAATLYGVAGGASASTCLATAAVAQAQIAEIVERLRAHRTQAPSLVGRSLEFRPIPSTLRSTAMPVHPRCRCQQRYGSRLTYGSTPESAASTILEQAAKGQN